MEMLYRPDWSEVAARYEAWWGGESLGRPAVWIETPKDGVERRDVPVPAALREQWTNADYVVARWEESFRTTAFFGEAYPCMTLNVGPCCAAAYVGCPVHMAPQTVWFGHIVDDLASYHVEFDEDNEWWQVTKQLTQATVDAGAGKWFVDIADIGAACDLLSYLRGPDALCTDLLDCPDEVRRVLDELNGLVFRVYDELAAIVATKMQGTSGWARLWGPGKLMTTQNDFSCMISKPTYDSVFLPELAAECDFFDHTIYHLDGPGAIQHLDTLLELPTLGGVQWIPGAGAPSAGDPLWRPMLKRIQAAGKKLQVFVSATEALDLASDLSPDGLFLMTWAGSEQEGRELLAAIAAG